MKKLSCIFYILVVPHLAWAAPTGNTIEELYNELIATEKPTATPLSVYDEINNQIKDYEAKKDELKKAREAQMEALAKATPTPDPLEIEIDELSDEVKHLVEKKKKLSKTLLNNERIIQKEQRNYQNIRKRTEAKKDIWLKTDQQWFSTLDRTFQAQQKALDANYAIYKSKLVADESPCTQIKYDKNKKISRREISSCRQWLKKTDAEVNKVSKDAMFKFESMVKRYQKGVEEITKLQIKRENKAKIEH